MTWSFSALRDSVFGSAPAVYIEQKLIGAEKKVDTAKEAVKTTAAAVVTGVEKVATSTMSGIKIGIILACVVLAFYVIANLNMLFPRRNN